MKTTHQLITLLLLSLILFACKEEEKYFNGHEHLFDCHDRTTWDSLKTHNTLIGEWEWEYNYCYSAGGPNSDIDKGLSIEFKSDNTLDVKKDGQVSQTSTWEVQPPYDGSYWISLKPSVFQLIGAIYFCEDRIEFYASNGDLCDNFFIRK